MMSSLSHEFPDSYEQYYDLGELEERAERRELIRKMDTFEQIARARVLVAEYQAADTKRAEQTWEEHFDNEGEDG
jgi:hypothetical protein